ncbi:MAG TPA: enoyl-CoA hydratase-related protein [Nitrospiria bacterium]|nr:enoyl-CoA hydratase-related protein [Nitrospiria bacterium]HUK55598.1 enoyl-CoA hydratase-related protein [Nitrospiria bacterium]
MSQRLIACQIEDDVATVTLDNPPANALSSALLDELNRVIDEMGRNAEAKAIVITGAGKVFAAGADIKEIADIESGKRGRQLSARGQAIMDRIERMNKLMIAAVNGLFCLGGGLELAMACHLRIAGDRVRLGLPEITLGIIPGFGGTQRLPRLVGTAKALELILTGDRVKAEEGRRMGLVNEVVPDAEVLSRARAVAKKVAGMGQLAVRAALKAVLDGRTQSLESGLELEAKLFGSLCETADMKEGLHAFLQKRPARFRDA